MEKQRGEKKLLRWRKKVAVARKSNIDKRSKSKEMKIREGESGTTNKNYIDKSGHLGRYLNVYIVLPLNMSCSVICSSNTSTLLQGLDPIQP